MFSPHGAVENQVVLRSVPREGKGLQELLSSNLILGLSLPCLWLKSVVGARNLVVLLSPQFLFQDLLRVLRDNEFLRLLVDRDLLWASGLLNLVHDYLLLDDKLLRLLVDRDPL